MLATDRIYHGDALSLIKEIPDGSIDCIVTDPPYRVTSRGGSGTMSGYWTAEQTKRGRIFDHNDCDIADYLPELFRVLKDSAHCYIMCNNVNLPHFFEEIGKSAFHFVKLLVWDKQNKICGRYYMGQVEHIFLLRKGADKPINDCGASDLLSFVNHRDKTRDGGNVHDSQKPVPLFQTMIENSTDVGGVVLDPFIGSGTAAIAAMRAKRRFIGFEMDSTYFSLAERRISLETAQKTLF